MLKEQLKHQINQEAEHAANQRQGRSMPYRYGYKDGYYDGAETYATRAITAEAENDRLRKALEGARDYFVKCNNNNEAPDLLTAVLSIDEAITPKPTTNE